MSEQHYDRNMPAGQIKRIHTMSLSLDPVSREGKRVFTIDCTCGWGAEADTQAKQVESMQYHQINTLWTEAGHGWITR